MDAVDPNGDGSMFSKLTLFFVLILTIIVVSGAVSAANTTNINTSEDRFNTVTLPFVENQGQIPDSKVKYSVQTFVGNVYLENGQIDYALTDNVSNGVFLVEKFQNSQPIIPKGTEKSDAQVNYFIGNDPSKWYSNLPTYQQVQYKDLYPGIDLNLKAHGSNIEKIYTLNPGTSPGTIKTMIEGAQKIIINQNGELEITTSLGNLILTKPIAFQTINGLKINVPVRYTLTADTYTYTPGSYNKNYPLIIDPLLSSTYLGGADEERANGITRDQAGNIFITGITDSTNFPVTSYARYKIKAGYYDAFVSKFSSNLSTLLASTYFGGTSTDEGCDIAIDNANNVLVTGLTLSSDIPTTPGAYQRLSNNGFDAFITRFSNSLSNLLTSTYLGGDADDYGYAIAVDRSNIIYVSGYTNSDDFPVTSLAPYRTIQGSDDAFVSKLDYTLTSLLGSTYLGGTEMDRCESIALDQLNNIYIAGTTASTDFPTTTNAPYKTNKGYNDAFATILDNGITRIVGSTYLGGTSEDHCLGIALDQSRNVFITGYTHSTNFPVTSNAPYKTNKGESDIFVSKFSSGLTSLMASTYLGGTTYDGMLNGETISIDQSNNVYITGYTDSTNFPVTSNAPYKTNQGGTDVFISKFNNQLTSLIGSTYLGGANTDWGYGIITDSEGNIYVTGVTDSTNFPVPCGVYKTNHGYYDAFVSKLFIDPLTVSSSDPANNAVNVARDKLIKVTFNQPVLWGNFWVELKNSSGTIIPITKSITGNVLTITPSSLLSAGTRYDLCLHTGCVKDYGDNLLAGKVISFTTDGTAPTVVSSDPINNAVNVPRNKVIKVTFSEPLKWGNWWIELKNSIGAIIPITKSITGNVLTITHPALLAANTRYIIALHSGCVTDYAGNPLVGVVRSFTTGTT